MHIHNLLYSQIPVFRCIINHTYIMTVMRDTAGNSTMINTEILDDTNRPLCASIAVEYCGIHLFFILLKRNPSILYRAYTCFQMGCSYIFRCKA